MIIHYFYVIGFYTFPYKANAPLVVYSYAHLPDTVALQRF